MMSRLRKIVWKTTVYRWARQPHFLKVPTSRNPRQSPNTRRPCTLHEVSLAPFALSTATG